MSSDIRFLVKFENNKDKNRFIFDSTIHKINLFSSRIDYTVSRLNNLFQTVVTNHNIYLHGHIKSNWITVDSTVRFRSTYSKLNGTESDLSIRIFNDLKNFLSRYGKVYITSDSATDRLDYYNDEELINLQVVEDPSERIFLEELYQENIPRDSLIKMIRKIEYYFKCKDIDKVDVLLREFDVNLASMLLMISILRTTFRAKDHLEYWTPLVVTVYEKIKERRGRPDELLKGLLTPKVLKFQEDITSLNNN